METKNRKGQWVLFDTQVAVERDGGGYHNKFKLLDITGTC
jgi:hypothetical protein